ncbi:hypothetical protein [Azotobacter salinestris]
MIPVLVFFSATTYSLISHFLQRTEQQGRQKHFEAQKKNEAWRTTIW